MPVFGRRFLPPNVQLRKGGRDGVAAPVDGVVASGQGSQTSAAVAVETIPATACTSGQGGQSSVSAAVETISGAVTSSNRSQSSVAAAAETLSGIAVTSGQGSQSSAASAAETIVSSSAVSAQGGQSSSSILAETLTGAVASGQGSQSSLAAGAETITAATATSAQGSQSSSAVSTPTNVGGAVTSGQGGQSSSATAAESIGAAATSAQGGQSSASVAAESIAMAATSGQGSQRSNATSAEALAASVGSAQGGQSSSALSGLSIGADVQSFQAGQSSIASEEAPGVLGQASSGQGGQSSSAAADYTPQTAFTFTVTRTGDLSVASTVDWAVTGSGAHPATADDFVGGVFPSGTVNFGVGQTTAVITVNVNPDAAVETDEGFTVTLSSSSRGVITTATADGAILNDDIPPEPEIITWRGGDDAPRRGSKRRKYQDEYYETQRQAREFLREQIRLAFEGPQAEEIAAEIKPYVPKKYRKAEYTAPPRWLDLDRIMESRKMMARIEAAAQAAIDDEDDAITALLL